MYFQCPKIPLLKHVDRVGKLNRLISCSLALLFGLSSLTQAVAVCAPQNEEQYEQMRRQMVEIAVKGAGVTDKRVIGSMLATPRTGSGYQAAILSPLVKTVYSIEIVEKLGKSAAKVLKKLEYDNVVTKIGDGYKGWAEHAPFDKIIVTCSPEDIPGPLVEQLKEGGTIIVPMGERHQQTLYLMQKQNGKMVRKALRTTLFVPMTGTAEDKRKVLPDPLNPSLDNGDFEEGLHENGFAKGWYYQRQMRLVEDEKAPSGKNFVEFKNSVPGQLSQLMQVFAVDGRHISVVKFSTSFSCDNIVVGPHRNDLPVAAISFFDEDRKELGMYLLGPHKGSKNWLSQSREIRVPHTAREGIVRIGLFGATGTARFDNLKVEASKRIE